MRLKSFLTSSYLLAAALPAHAGLEQTLCAIPDSNAAHDFVIDMRDGRTSGLTHYRVSESVRVVFVNKNPFVFDYKTSITSVPRAEPGLEYFLTLFSPDEILGKEVKKEDSSEAAVAALGDADTDCSDRIADKLSPADDAFTKAVDALVASDADIRKSIKAIEDASNPPRAILAETAAECSRLAKAVEALSAGLDTTSLGEAISHTEKALKVLEDSVSALRVGVDEVSATPPAGCTSDQVQDALKPYRKRIADYRASAAGFNERIVAARNTQTTLAKQRKDLDAALVAERFTSTSLIREQDPSDVTIKVWRKKTAEEKYPPDDKALVDVMLRFGGRQRFTVAVGASFAALEKPEYDGIQGYAVSRDGDLVLDDMGKSNLTRVVGKLEDSQHRIRPMVLMHTRIVEGRGAISGFHATFGITADLGSDANEIEYLVGGSMSFAEERFFLTVGMYNGVVTSLQPSFFIGQELAKDVSDLPVRSDRIWKAGAALSYKFR